MSCQSSHCQQVWLYSALKTNMKTKTRRLNFKRQQNNTQKEQNIYITDSWTDRDPHLLYNALPWNVYRDSCKSHVSFTMATALCLQLLYCMTTWKEITRLGKNPKGQQQHKLEQKNTQKEKRDPNCFNHFPPAFSPKKSKQLSSHGSKSRRMQTSMQVCPQWHTDKHIVELELTCVNAVTNSRHYTELKERWRTITQTTQINKWTV